MVNIYKCDLCGVRMEIPQGHPDNKKINVAGIVYLDSCENCKSEGINKMQEYDSKNVCPICGQTLVFHSAGGREWETCPDGHDVKEEII